MLVMMRVDDALNVNIHNRSNHVGLHGCSRMKHTSPAVFTMDMNTEQSTWRVRYVRHDIVDDRLG